VADPPRAEYARRVKLLCISDIHGHAGALAAVLATAERSGYDKVLVAGDLCFPGPEPLETWRRLTQAKAICVQGAGDRALSTLDLDKLQPRNDHERDRLARLSAVRRELGDLILARLARLPTTVRLPLDDGNELLLVHGSPSDPLEPFSHDMSDEEIAALLGDDPADIVVCGGSHVPFDRLVAGARVINVGSVGEAPTGSGSGFGHADATLIEIQSVSKGAPQAAGAIVSPPEVRVTQIAVPLHKAA
jgi:predicted phosphodiesterase